MGYTDCVISRKHEERGSREARKKVAYLDGVVAMSAGHDHDLGALF